MNFKIVMMMVVVVVKMVEVVELAVVEVAGNIITVLNIFHD